ncbi:hypothetical protein QJ48_26160 [Paenibacillus sp. A3]|nr:hypothetical protein QJ48_26160 [Paenibacillus sp. A3]
MALRGLWPIAAYVLAGELKLAQGEYAPRAFAAYEQEMRAFVEKNQKIGQSAAEGMVAGTSFKIILQNWMLRV